MLTAGIPASPALCTTHPGLLLPVTAVKLSVHYIITPAASFVNMKIPHLRNLSRQTVDVEQGEQDRENLHNPDAGKRPL